MVSVPIFPDARLPTGSFNSTAPSGNVNSLLYNTPVPNIDYRLLAAKLSIKVSDTTSRASVPSTAINRATTSALAFQVPSSSRPHAPDAGR